VLPVALTRFSASSLALLSLQPRSRWGARRRLAEFAAFDIFQFEFCANARWIELLPPDATVVYSAHNVERDYFAAECTGRSAGHWSLRRLELLERQAVRDSALVLSCSAQDAARLEQLYGGCSRTAIVPNGVDSSLLRLDRAALRDSARGELGFSEDDRVLVFVGGDAGHNRDAVEFMVERVLPQLDPRTRLLIVGRCVGERYRRDDRVVSLGFAPSLAGPLAAADVAVNPVQYGSGSNVKLAEYLAARLPIVSTPVGVRGFEDFAFGIRIAPRGEFVDALRAPVPAPECDPSALESLTWQALGHKVFDEYGRLLEERDPAPVAAV
jgi:glycosyltransferase involved in cell wall biosynthesis